MTLIIRTPLSCPDERKYILAYCIGECWGVSYTHVPEQRGDVQIELSGDPRRTLRLNDTFFRKAGDSWLDPSTTPRPPLPEIDQDFEAIGMSGEQALPVLFGERLKSGRWINESDETVELGLDVFGSLFFLLTRYEEVGVAGEGDHEWYPVTRSVLDLQGCLHRAIGNEYLDLLWRMVARTWPALRRKDRRYRLRLSHDVDWPTCNAGRGGVALLRTLAGDVLARRDGGLLARRVMSIPELIVGNTGRDVCNTFSQIMDRSEALGIQSAFYFICGHTAGSIDGVYHVRDPWIRSLLQAIHDRGHEIGLHPSYNTFLDADQIAKEFLRLREVCEDMGIHQREWGGRQHYLRWRAPDTWRHWEEAGLTYDSSVGHAEKMGFRAGFCYEYPTYDLIQRKALQLRERPLVAMEVSALDIMTLTPEEAVGQMLGLAATCRRHQGDFTLLWHNNRVVTKAEREMYGRVLAGCHQ